MILVKTYWVIPPIIDGTKSQTRRFTDPNLKAGSIHVMKRFLSDRSFARVRIRRVWQEHLGDMTDEDAIARATTTASTIFVASAGLTATAAPWG